jgi:hypothetical protein
MRSVLVVGLALGALLGVVRADENDDYTPSAIGPNETEAHATALKRLTSEVLAQEGVADLLDESGVTYVSDQIEAALRDAKTEPLDAKKPEGNVRFTAHVTRAKVRKILAEKLGPAWYGPAAGRTIMLHVKVARSSGGDDDTLAEALRASCSDYFTARGFSLSTPANTAAVPSALHVFIKAKLESHAFAGDTPQVAKGFSGALGVLACTGEVVDRRTNATVASTAVRSTAKFHDLQFTDADDLPEPWFKNDGDAGKLEVVYSRALGAKVAALLTRRLREKGPPRGAPEPGK